MVPLYGRFSGPLVITPGPRPRPLFPITGSDSLILKVLHDLVNTAPIKPTHFNHFFPENGGLFCTHDFKNWFTHKKYMFKQQAYWDWPNFMYYLFTDIPKYSAFIFVKLVLTHGSNCLHPFFHVSPSSWTTLKMGTANYSKMSATNPNGHTS